MMIDELEKNGKRIRELYDEQAEKKFSKATVNVPVAALMTDAKHFIRDLISAGTNAFDQQPEIVNQYHLGGKLGRSVPATVARIETLMSIAAKHEKDLAPWGYGKEEVEKGKKLILDLQAANLSQEKAVKDLPPKGCLTVWGVKVSEAFRGGAAHPARRFVRRRIVFSTC